MWVPGADRGCRSLPERLFRWRGASCGHRRRWMCRVPEVDENLRHDGAVREERQHPPASATLAAPKNVDGEDASQERRPVETAGKDGGRDTGGSGEGSRRFVVGVRGRGRHDLGSSGSVGGEDAVVPREMPPWRRDQRRQPERRMARRPGVNRAYAMAPSVTSTFQTLA